VSCDRTHGPDVTRITHLSRKAIKRISSLWALGTGGQSLRQSGAPHSWRVPVRGAVCCRRSNLRASPLQVGFRLRVFDFPRSAQASQASGYTRARATPPRRLERFLTAKSQGQTENNREPLTGSLSCNHILLSHHAHHAQHAENVFQRHVHTRVHTGGIDLGPVAAWQKMVARTVVVAPSLLRF
jgi:hypothetical protein